MRTNPNFDSNDIYYDYINSEVDLLVHTLKHKEFKNYKKAFPDRKSVYDKRYQEERSLLEDIIERATVLSVNDDGWSVEFKKLLYLRNVKLSVCVAKNLKMVTYHANKWHTGYKKKIPLDDLIQEGNMGLYKAVTRFNPDLGYRFYTYAVWWVRQSLQRYSDDNAEIVRMPYAVVNQVRHLKKEHDKHVQNHGESQFQDYVDEHAKAGYYKVSKVKTFSLDKPLSDDEERTMLDTLMSDLEGPDEVYETAELNKVVEEVLGLLDDKEKSIILARFGLYGTEQKSLREIGDSYNLTKERIRQIEEVSLRKMKLQAGKCSKKAKELIKNARFEYARLG